eukprot:TRINITY_DN1551_c0_g1_i1.p1 TRINITY_DN1551_c0_g1~~TRINITY_DN1551_c0_g1_i1.p1  ORF type:complete len:304 (+),score=150.22 TRINITY_DN1551_c0_g1_i1:58-969(+)
MTHVGRSALSDITSFSSFSTNIAHPTAGAKPASRHIAPTWQGAEACGCVDLVDEVMDNLRLDEPLGQVAHNHLLLCQVEVTDKMRAILVDWLVDVHLKYKCRPETIYLAVNLLDRFLMVKPVEKKKLQLVGCVAMMLACKYEEIMPPEVRDFVHISANTYTRTEMLAMEKSMLVELDYNLTVPTMWQFLTQLIGNERADTMRHGAEYLAEQTLMCAKLSGFPASLQAAACVYLSRRVLGAHQSWPSEMQARSQYSESDLCEVVHALEDYIMKVPRMKVGAVRKKYSHSRYSNISQAFDTYAQQ